MARGRWQIVIWSVTATIAACVAPAGNRASSAAAPRRPTVQSADDPPHTALLDSDSARPTNCPAPARVEGTYDLAQLSIFSRTLFYVRENHPEDVSPRARELLVAALEAVATQDGEVQVEREREAPPRWVMVTVSGQQCILNLQRVNAPWSLRSTLQEAARFIQGRLAPASSGDQGERLMKIEIAATNGMLSELDHRSRLLDRETYREVRANLPKGPAPNAADKASIRAEDSPTAIGPASSPMRIALPRTAQDAMVVYLRLKGFPGGISSEVERGLAAVEGGPPKGIVLDLRDNSGGLLDEAVRVADVFIKTGTLASIVSRQQRKDYPAHDDGHEPSGALVVLVNRGTASGAELVAAAIKNLGRGVVLGEPTAGAATVRAFFDLPTTRHVPPNKDRDVVQNTLDGVKPSPPVDQRDPEPLGLLLTIGHLQASGGAAIQGAGLQPDVPSPWPASDTSRPDEDCLHEFAKSLIGRARDPRRATLLAAAKALAPQMICRPAAPSRR